MIAPAFIELCTIVLKCILGLDVFQYTKKNNMEDLYF